MFNVMEKWNLIPPQYPYRLIKSEKSQHPFEFEINPKFLSYGWKIVLILFFSMALSCAFQIWYEDTKVVQKGCHSYLLFVPLFITIFVVKHSISVDMTSFLNNMILLESRHMSESENFHLNFWRKQSSFIRFVVKWVCSSLQVTSFLLTLSEVVFPNVPWKVVPSTLTAPLGSLVSSNVIRILLRSSVTLVYSMTAMRIWVNFVAINWLLNLLTGTYLLYSSLILFQRKVDEFERSPQSKDPLPLVQLYREIQLLHLQYNSIHRFLLVPGTLVQAICLICITGSTLVLYGNKLDIVSNICMGYSWLDGIFLILLCFHFAVKVHFTSKVILTTGRKLKRTAAWKRYWMSFPAMKVFICSGNFFEKITPVRVLDLGITLTINFVLLG